MNGLFDAFCCWRCSATRCDQREDLKTHKHLRYCAVLVGFSILPRLPPPAKGRRAAS